MTERLHNATYLNCQHKNFLHLNRSAILFNVLKLVLESVARWAPDLVFSDPRALEEILEESAKLTYNTPYAIIKIQEHMVSFSSLHDLVPSPFGLVTRIRTLMSRDFNQCWRHCYFSRSPRYWKQ
jgi:hypothetical protein